MSMDHPPLIDLYVGIGRRPSKPNSPATSLAAITVKFSFVLECGKIVSLEIR
jgi:hypothetical protein